jgi:acetyl esterase/lipase
MNNALLVLSLLVATEAAPKVEVLWPDGAPGAMGTEKQDRPTLTVFLPPPETATGAAVVICPGGGYRAVVDSYEGRDPARWLASRGVAGFVLRYRIAPRYHHPAPMQDVQRAIRTVRARAKEWGVDPNKIGVWGFSAGGHLASTAATHFDAGRPTDADPIERVGCRPDFAILCYPVITLKGPFAHIGSRNNLLGPDADPALIDSLSNETQVTPQTPSTFLFHTNADAAVPAENSVLFYLALRQAKVPAELHVYEHGRHGVGLAPKHPVLSSWTARLEDWMRGHDLMEY